jgi:hypothetical protein
MIKHIPAYTANYPLSVWILPWTLRGDKHFFNAHVVHALLERAAIDVVPIAQEIAGRVSPREGLDHLLGCPLGCGVFRDMKVDDAAAFVSQDDQYEEHPERHGWHGKEIQGDDIFDMVVQKCLPGGRGRLLVTDSVLFHGRYGAGLHKRQGVLPAGPQTRQPHPEETVGGMETGPRYGALRDGHLVAKGNDFKLQSKTRAEQRRQKCQESHK